MPAKIVSLRDIKSEILMLGLEDPYVVATSGGFDPIHPGHLSCIEESAEMADVLVILVNDDNFLTRKKGKPFMPLEHRCQVVSMVKGVDFVIPFHAPEGDDTVIHALEVMEPSAFTKGGDRKDKKTIPEWEVCQDLDINLIVGIGMEKKWSSSNYIKEWEEFILSRKGCE